MLTSAKLAQAYRNACMAELEALKPGNVHVFADGHGMTIQDFIKSADASAAVIAQANLSVGERIFQSVKATQIAVGMNTNLGIILLCAPLIHAALQVSQAVDGENQSSQQRLN
jgi:triphosphoribosyl-dephospho-CoA synthase